MTTTNNSNFFRRQECDGCHRVFDFEPKGSFQTYNGTWFCSDWCGKRAGW